MPDFIAKPEDSSHLLTEQAQQYSTADKLRMEADLLSSGIRQGFMNRAQDAWDNKAATALEFGTAAIIGGALTAMHQAGGRWGVAAKFATYGLIGVAVGDVASRVDPTAMAMHDTWNDPSKFEANQSIVANRLGSAFFDYPLMAAGGLAGSATAARLMPHFAKPVTFQNSIREPGFQPWNEPNLLSSEARGIIADIKGTNVGLRNQLPAAITEQLKIPMSFRIEQATTTRLMPIVPISSSEIKMNNPKFDPKTFIKTMK